MARPERCESKIKIAKKLGRRNKKTERERQQEAKCLTAKRQKKKCAESTKNCAKRGYYVDEKSATTKCNIAMNEMSGGKINGCKKKNNQQSHHQPITFSKLNAKQNKASTSKNAHGSKNSAVKKTA